MKLNRVSLNVVGLNRIGLNRIGSPSRGSSSGSDRSYIDPEVLASLKAVCICYGKSNDDPDRAIVKNLVDPDNPFVISNAAFKLNSGFGEYKEDFTTWSKVAGTSIITDSKYVLTDEKAITNAGYFLWNRLAKDSFKVKISNIPNGGWMSYRYRITEEDTQFSSLFIREDGIYTLPATVAGSDVDFFISTASAPAKDWVGLTITQIPSFEGAFFTDGIDDLITSTKTVQEMLGGSNEITVVSLITHISGTGKYNIIGDGGIQVSDYSGQTFMAGTSSNGEKIVELGDKEKLQAVQYTTFDSKLAIGLEDSSYAYYGTFVFNKENVPVDWIHQVIAYFNLDRTLKPDILCNTIKQGITNENHAEFGDRLIDFSGNGRDIQLNNIAWKGDSGIGKYEVDFLDSSIWTSSNSTITSSKIDCKNAISHIMLLYYNVGDKEYPDIPSFKIIKTGADIDYSYIDETGSPKSVKIVDGVNVLPASHNTLYSGSGRFCGFGNPGIGNSVIITQIPSHAGALCLDGVNDFGKVTGMPVYKDYTVVTDREIFANIGAILSKNNPGAFVETAGNSVYSFGQATSGLKFISTRSISYLSKYSYCGQSIAAGAAEDVPDMWLGTIRDGDSRFFNGAIYSLMSFPYSMSEFLIERQLKKHKLGTLYPDMVEFRPIVKSNLPYSSITYSVNPGEYISVDSMVTITVTLPNTSDKLMEVSCNAISDISISGDNGVYEITGKIVKSPQKINLVISSYLTMLNNETLISNETLIKNE